MKHLLLIAFAMILGTQAHASVSADEFVDAFVAGMNRRLVFLNNDRIATQKRPYCTGLSSEKIELIRTIVRENSEQTNDAFVSKLSETLKCYPIAFPQLGREGWGILTNTKALWMDIKLIQETLRDLGNQPYDAKVKLLDGINLHEAP
jgi:hypothetical protein